MLISSSLEDLKIPSWEFCRVLGNIIDNAIYALQEIETNRKIQIEIYEDIKIYGFKIKNNGPQIPAEYISKIFEPGITSKGGKGEGMGLAIVKEVLTQYGGEIRVHSDKDMTVFEGIIPR